MKKQKKWLIAIMLVCVFAMAGCAAKKNIEAPSKVAAKKEAQQITEPIKIGLSLPLTGEAASYGEAALGGAELAAKEINDAGGINGNKIELIPEDDQCSSSGGAMVANKLTNIDQVLAMVHFCSAAAGAGTPIAQNAKIPSIVLGAAPELTQNRDYIFRNYPSDSFQGKFAAEFIYNKLNKKNAAVIFVKNNWGQGIRDVFTKRFKELGGNIVYDESVMQDSTDLRTQIAKAKATNPDALYFPVYLKNGVAGLKQLKELEFNAPIISGDGFEAEEILNMPEAEGTLYIAAKTNNPEYFKKQVKEISGRESNVFTPYVYDAIKIFAEAIKKAGTDKKAIRDALANMSYKEGMSSPLIEFDEQGDLKQAEFEVKVIKNGKGVSWQAE
ncbi:MAG: ABC transporter substrate-binding protein [bacterium]